MEMKLFPCGLELTAPCVLAQRLGHGQHLPQLTMITSLPRWSVLVVENATVALVNAHAMLDTVALHASALFAQTTAMDTEHAKHLISLQMTFLATRILKPPLLSSLPLIAPMIVLSAPVQKTLAPNTTVLGMPLARLAANVTLDTEAQTACRKNALQAMMSSRDMVVPKDVLAVDVVLVTTPQACVNVIPVSMATAASPLPCWLKQSDGLRGTTH